MMHLPYVSMLESGMGRSMIAHADAFVGHLMRLSAGGVTGTAEIVVSDKDGVGIVLRIVDCLMKTNANNCLSLSQLQRSGNVMVNLDGTAPSIKLGRMESADQYGIQQVFQSLWALANAACRSHF